jgi:hypothetical protein
MKAMKVSELSWLFYIRKMTKQAKNILLQYFFFICIEYLIF